MEISPNSTALTPFCCQFSNTLGSSNSVSRQQQQRRQIGFVCWLRNYSVLCVQLLLERMKITFDSSERVVWVLIVLPLWHGTMVCLDTHPILYVSMRSSQTRPQPDRAKYRDNPKRVFCFKSIVKSNIKIENSPHEKKSFFGFIEDEKRARDRKRA